MTFAAIKQAIKDYCLLSSPEADIRVGQAINRHYRRITSSLGLESARFVTRAVSTTPGVQTVTFTEIEKIDRILDMTDGTTLLTEVSLHTIRSAAAGTGSPTTWALQSTDADTVTVRLNVLPQSAYDLQADGWTTLADLSGTQEPVFAESFHDILIWAVIAEEQLKKEKIGLAKEYSKKADDLLSALRFQLADSPTRDTRQGGTGDLGSSGGSGSGSSTSGATAYTQTALLTFDRGAGTTPFAVAASDAPYVANLGAEFLGNIATDRLIGRDSAGTGKSEQIQLGGGLEFSGGGSIQRSALGGDVTAGTGSNTLTIATDAVLTAKIANDQVTYAKIQNVSATARVLGRKTAGAGDVEELTVTETLDLVGSAASGDILIRQSAAWARMPRATDVPSGRLTLTTAVPVTTADVTGATTLYYAPYQGNTITLYDGTYWITHTFTELSISLAGKTASTPYDVFVYSNSGAAALEVLAWSGTGISATRATALTTQNGILVQNGALTRRYVGTIYINSSGGQTDDALAIRAVWNYYHRVTRPMRVLETTDTWNYTTATIRPANNAATNALAFVVGVAEDRASAEAGYMGSIAGGGYAVVGVGYDSTTAFASGSLINYSALAGTHMLRGAYATIPAAGYHYFQALERGDGSNATTFFGDNATPTYMQSGIQGEVRG